MTNNNNSNFFWQMILEELKHELTPEILETWFYSSFVTNIDYSRNLVTIMSNEPLVSQYLKNVHHATLKQILFKRTGVPFDIIYDYLDNSESTPASNNKVLETSIKMQDDFSTEAIPAEQLIEKNDFFKGDKPSGTQNFYKKQSLPLEEYKVPSQKANTNLFSKQNPTLNKNFTFDNFVVGEGNKYAYAMADAVVGSPGTLYNPLFIYGGVGLGKTHLLHAVGNEIESNFPQFKILCVSSETMLNDLIKSINTKNNDTFIHKYRDIDVLLIDDIQFLKGKGGLQEALFHTFNELQMNQKQIVLISDREPSQLDGLQQRLVSRFQQGGTADITPPDFVTRMAILQHKCEQFDIHIDNSILTFIANNVSSNIRELEGILKQIKLRVDSLNEAPTLETAESILKKVVSQSKKVISPDLIISVCSDFYKIKKDDILSSSRKKEVVLARNSAMYLCRELTDLSFPAIGTHFNKDHSSILYSCNKMATLIIEDETISLNIEQIKEQIKNTN